MRQHDSLGTPRGAGRVDDVAGVVDRRSGLGIAEALVWLSADLVLELVEAQQPDAIVERREVLLEIRRRQHDPDIGVGGDEGQAIGGESGIERHVCRVQLQDGEHAHIAVDRAIEQQTHPVTRTDPPASAQETCQLVGACVQLCVAQPVVRAIHGEGVAAPIQL